MSGRLLSVATPNAVYLMPNKIFLSKKHIYFCLPLVLASLRLLETLRAVEALLFVYLLCLILWIVYKRSVRKDFLLISLLSISSLLFAFYRSGPEDVLFTGRTLSTILLFYLGFQWLQKNKIMFASSMIYVWSIALFFLNVYSYQWEYSIIFAALFSLSLFRKEYLWSILFLTLVITINQRTGLVAILGVEILKLLSTFRLKHLISFMLGSFVIYLFATNLDLEAYRSFGLLLNINMWDLVDAWNNAISLADRYSYVEFVFDQRSTLTEDGQLSNHLRIRKWASAYVSTDIKSFFGGLGGGFFGRAADSGFIRIIFEQGFLISLIVFSGLFKFFRRVSFEKKLIILSFCISNLFLDVMQSVYLMTFLGLIMNVSDTSLMKQKYPNDWKKNEKFG
jgi:hypothetical protein